MITDFEDFCTWVFVVVDDTLNQIAPLFRRPGPKPQCTDSELIAMCLIGECRGWHMETELLSCWKEYQHLFPNIPSQSRFNRRRRNLMQAMNLIWIVLLRSLEGVIVLLLGLGMLLSAVNSLHEMGEFLQSQAILIGVLAGWFVLCISWPIQMLKGVGAIKKLKQGTPTTVS
jgi:hypothetical protein